jgi:cobalt-zinc-cadmium efflux system membrane fusion protein
MNYRKSSFAFLALIVSLGTVACKKTGTVNSDPHERHTNPTNADHETHAEANTPSDLDRPLNELVALTCEHEKKTFECTECRYEVGFVRLPANLFEGGLIKTVKVERKKIEEPVTLTGEIRFDERRVGHVSSQSEGIVKKVHVALGDEVKNGQALIEIESVTVGEAQSVYLENQSLLELARLSYERVAALRKENITSEKEFLKAKQELEAAKIRVTSAQGKLTRLGSGGTTSGRIVLRAPMNGAVLAMHAVSGEVARMDESLITVGDNTSVWVWADLYERDIAAVKNGQAKMKLNASISVKAYPGVEFPGTVDLVSPAMDESSRTVKVRIETKNDDRRLLAGMFATVKVFLPGTDEALAVPRIAVMEDEGRSFVFIHYQGEDYVRRPVVTGRKWASWVEVTKGLTLGQLVVADGAFLMKSDVLRSKMGAGCAD